MNAPCGKPLPLAAALWVLLFAAPAWGQALELSGDANMEAVFAPLPPSFSTAQFELNLSVSLLEASFLSQTRLTLQDLLQQAFVLQVALAPLVVENELRFKSRLAFERNRLSARLRMDTLALNNVLVVQDIGVQSPQAQMGTTFGIAWMPWDPLNVFVQVGFGVTETTEDLDLDLDRQVDLNVQTPFAFSEAVLGAALRLSPLWLEVKVVLGQQSRQVFSASLDFPDVQASLLGRMTFERLSLPSRFEIQTQTALSPLTLHTLTVVQGIPYALTRQELAASLALVEDFMLRSKATFDQFGISELRLGVGWVF